MTWHTYLGKQGTWSVELNNVSTNAINSYMSGVTRWDLLLNSCVSMTSRALNMSGVFNIGIHPYLLHAQMYLRSIGIRPMLHSHFLLNH
jgi:hypothetical protein